MRAYYNEIDPKAAAWLRELIRVGVIAPGDVDERSIVDVRPADLRGYRQCHFFAGIGVWSFALRQADWSDSEEVWTGSCPCQPFSDAGASKGFDDERHLWPTWFALIRECRPRVVFGEQVASKDGLTWLDVVHADLESATYAVGAVDTCAAGFGCPGIRQRFFFVADATNAKRWTGERGAQAGARPDGERRRGSSGGGVDGGMADTGLPERRAHASIRHDGNGQGTERPEGSGGAGERGESRGLADSDERGCALERTPRLHGDGQSGNDAARRGAHGGMAHAGSERRQQERVGALGDEGAHGRRAQGNHIAASDGENSWPGPVNGHWRDADWLCCTDGKWRPVEPGTSPLVTGAPARLGRLRGYGNAINAEVAAEFIAAYIDVRAS